MRMLITVDGRCSEPSVDEVRRRLAAGGDDGFWLDIEAPDESDYHLLLDDFRFHPLAVAEVREQNRRPKLDEFQGYAFVVLFGVEWAGQDLSYREHHLFLSGSRLVTVHNEPSPALRDLFERVRQSPDLTQGRTGFMDYLVVNQLVESLFPVLDQLDDTIDQLEDSILGQATIATLARLSTLKHQVTDLRRILGPQRDVFERLLTHSLDRAGEDLSVYWRDVYEHLVRQYEQVDSLRDLLSSAMDVYLSTVSNRLNSTMKQLTVIASLFLPLTFLTGFFGMNFGVLVSKISAPSAFALGVGLMVAATVGQLYLFRRRGWI